MGLFKDMLRGDESLFKNMDALDYEFLPKILPFREQQQRQVAASIQPLLQERNGRNVFIYGPPGVGKTAAVRSVLRDLEDEVGEDIHQIFINCWNKNTTYKVLLDMCDQLDYKFVHNKHTDELMRVVRQLLSRKSAVFVFDEIDKMEDFDLLYTIIEEIHKKTILLITNYKDWLTNLDERIRSRLTPDLVEFKQYNAHETKEILKQRLGYAFVSGVWDQDALDAIAAKTAEIKDIRTGLYLMKEAGYLAEGKSAKKVVKQDAEESVSKLAEFQSKDSNELTEDEQEILNICKEHSGGKIGDLYKIYQEKGSNLTYKTFQRRIDKLEKGKFITTQKTEGGKDGNTTIIKHGEVKKLTDF